jgi:hypothetical protein
MLTPAQSQAVQEVFAGAREAGARIDQISEVQVTESFSGTKDNPVSIGDRVTVTVRVGEGGRLLPRREDAKPTDPDALSLLRIEVAPQIMFDGSGNPHTVYVAHARLIDVKKDRIIDVGRSGPTTEESEALQAGRPYNEYITDPAYRDASMSSEAQTRQEAVKQALGGIDLGVAGSSTPAQDGPPSEGPNKKWIAAAAAVVALGIGGVVLSQSGGDAPTEPAAAESDEPAVSSEPTPEESQSAAAADTGVAEEIGLVPGGVLRIDGMFEAGRCGGNPFESRLVLRDNGDHIGLQQLRPGGPPQESSGYPLKDGETIVLFDHGTNYDEMYVLQAGNRNGVLVGVDFYGPEGSIPDVGAFPRIENILGRDGFAQDVVNGGVPRNRFLESPLFPGPTQICDLDLTFNY